MSRRYYLTRGQTRQAARRKAKVLHAMARVMVMESENPRSRALRAKARSFQVKQGYGVDSDTRLRR